jgi:hypothetical protein
MQLVSSLLRSSNEWSQQQLGWWQLVVEQLLQLRADAASAGSLAAAAAAGRKHLLFDALLGLLSVCSRCAHCNLGELAKVLSEGTKVALAEGGREQDGILDTWRKAVAWAAESCPIEAGFQGDTAAGLESIATQLSSRVV